MRRPLSVTCVLIALVGVEAAAAPPPEPRQFPPQQALQQLKTAFARGDKGGEWATLSPAFKKRLSKRAGRHVDVGDYIAARNAYRNDPRIKELEQWIHTARMTHVHNLGNGRSRATIRFGAPLLVGKDIDVTIVNHAMWRLEIKGETEHFWGFVGDRRVEALLQRDNSVLVVTRDARGRIAWKNTYRPEQVQGYFRFNKWFFDGFGSMEEEFMRGLGSSGGQPRPPTRQPARRTR